MSDFHVDEETGSSAGTPLSGAQAIFVDSQGKILCTKDNSGKYRGRSNNASTAAQGAGFATDTYLTGSNVIIPSFSVQAGSKIRWRVSASKTAAGTATPIFQVRIGGAATTADTSRLTLTMAAGTAATDVGVFEILLTVRSVSATGVIQGTVSILHNGAAVGFVTSDGGVVEATSATFDNTALGGQNIGLSLNGGASASWTVTLVHVEADW